MIVLKTVLLIVFLTLSLILTYPNSDPMAAFLLSGAVTYLLTYTSPIYITASCVLIYATLILTRYEYLPISNSVILCITIITIGAILQVALKNTNR